MPGNKRKRPLLEEDEDGDEGKYAKANAAALSSYDARTRLNAAKRVGKPAEEKADQPAAELATKPAYPFVVDESDHAESPLDAYEDIVPILKQLARSLGVKPKALKIYDPYYCGGAVKRHMAKLGFPNCYNEKEDFYEFAEGSAKGPGKYDVLMTNPPYSGKHVERLFRYCARNPAKPCLLLLPHYFYTEPYFKKTIGSPTAMSSLFFLCPGLGRRYGYTPPVWAGAKGGVARSSTGASEGTASIAPFPTFWYCCAGQHTKTVVKRWKAQHEDKVTDAASRLATFQAHVFIARTTGDLPNELKSEFDLQRKRPNPRARKKMAKKRQQMTGETEDESSPAAAKKPPSKSAAMWRQKAQAQQKRERMNQMLNK